MFAASVAACVGASALYHRVTWTTRLRPWLRRVDHAGAYLLIAGTYTPVCLLVLGGAWRLGVLATICLCAGLAVTFQFASVDAPKWVAVAIGLALGWGGLAVLPQLVVRLTRRPSPCWASVGSSTPWAGAIVYTRRRANPAPAVFGYHELFHALTIVAVACQYIAIAFFVVYAG